MIKTDNISVSQNNIERIIEPSKIQNEEIFEKALRPKSFAEYIGQNKVKE